MKRFGLGFILAFGMVVLMGATSTYNRNDGAFKPDATLTFTAQTSGTYTKGTHSVDFIRSRQEGKFEVIQFSYVQSAVGTNGAGPILITVPNGLSVDTSITGICIGTVATDCDYATVLSSFGTNFGAGTNAAIGGKCVMQSATQFKCIGYYGGSVYDFWGTTGGIANANTRVGGWLRVPIQGR